LLQTNLTATAPAVLVGRVVITFGKYLPLPWNSLQAPVLEPSGKRIAQPGNFW